MTTRATWEKVIETLTACSRAHVALVARAVSNGLLTDAIIKHTSCHRPLMEALGTAVTPERGVALLEDLQAPVDDMLAFLWYRVTMLAEASSGVDGDGAGGTRERESATRVLCTKLLVQNLARTGKPSSIPSRHSPFFTCILATVLSG